MKILPTLIQFIQRSKKTILLIIIVSAATLSTSTIVSMWLSSFDNLHFPSLGTIRVIDVDVYGENITTTQNVKQINWGTVYLGALTNRSFYIRSISNTPVTLSLAISNVIFQDAEGQNVTATPPIGNPLTLTWDYNNTVLQWNNTIYVTLTLEISSDPSFIDYIINNRVGRFGFDIILRAVEVEQ